MVKSDQLGLLQDLKKCRYLGPGCVNRVYPAAFTSIIRDIDPDIIG